MRLALPSLAALVLAGLTAAAPAVAQQHAGHDKLGQVNFANTCSPAVQADLNRAVALLHSFWWGATTKAFNEVAQKDPSCGIAYWGVAMAALENPFGWPPNPKMLADGSAAVARARAAGAKSPRELDYIAAIETFYKDHDKVEHRTRAVAYEKAMEQLAARYPDDREAAIFYALALNATVVATDKTYAQQMKAAGILEAVFREQPNHPGAAHYLIHTLRLPGDRGEGARRRPALRHHRPGGAARPAHAVPHLHPARLLAGFHHLEPRLGRGRRQRLRPLPRLGLPRVRPPPAGPGPVGPPRARPDPGGREAERRELRDGVRPGGDPVALRARARPVGRRRVLVPPPRGLRRGRASRRPRPSSSSLAGSAPPGPAISPRPGTTRRGSRRCATACWRRRSATGPTRWTSSGSWSRGRSRARRAATTTPSS